jgi:hypothetical protein
LKFQAKNQTVVFQDLLVNANLYNFTVIDNGTGTTEFLLGEKSGTAGINGCTIMVEDTAMSPQVDLLATDADITDFGLYGSTFIGLQDIDLPASATTTEVLNSNFIQCGEVDPSTCTITNCNFISADITVSEGAILFDQASHNVSYCNFIANSRGIRVSFDGALGLTGCSFTNNTYDVNNSTVATNMDSYQPTEDGDTDVYAGSIIRVAQQFTATVGDLSRAIFSIRKQGSPTGNVYAVLYANSGGAPTGSALATSNPVDISGLTTSFADVDFEFEDEFTLSATDYHISIEYNGGTSANRLEVERLNAGSGSETCNTYVSSWSSQTYDHRFQVNRDGIVTVNATDSNPGTAIESGATKGATIIVNTVLLKVIVKDEDRQAIQDAQTAIYLLSDRTELMNEDTLVTGIAQQDYNYTGDVDVEVRVRKSDDLDVPRYKAYSSVQTITSDGLLLNVTLEENPFL